MRRLLLLAVLAAGCGGSTMPPAPPSMTAVESTPAMALPATPVPPPDQRAAGDTGQHVTGDS